jgi:hypothetical protein
MHNFLYYWISLYMFRTVFPSIIRSSNLYKQHQLYVIQVSWLLASKQSSNLYDIYLMLCVQSSTPDDGWKDRSKHVEWYSINSKIVHLVGFSIEIYHHARSHERQIYWSFYCIFHITIFSIHKRSTWKKFSILNFV